MKEKFPVWRDFVASSDIVVHPPQNSSLNIPQFAPPKIIKSRIQFIISVGIFFLCVLFFSLKNNTGSASILSGDTFITRVVAEKDFRSTSKQVVLSSKEDLIKLAEGAPLKFAFYRLQKGENISAVAYKFGLSLSTLLSLNSFDNAHSVAPGQRILLASQSGIIYNAKKTENIEEIAKLYGISSEEIMAVNSLRSSEIAGGTTLFLPGASLSAKAMADILGYLFVRPVKSYRFTSGFGMRRHPFGLGRRLHAGIDLAAPIGTPVHAAREGKIVFAGSSGNYGLMIRIQHNNGFSTVYAHLSRIRVQEGAWVSANQRIGDVGNTGRSTGPHLHFEVRKYGKPINPMYNGLQL
ncbi:MAG: peptidoglycan DD-metalloendopeptidase family protein [Brevinema sp.]